MKRIYPIIVALAILVSCKKEIMPTAIFLSESEITLQKGESMRLSVEYEPSDMTDRTVVWTSLDNDIATVNNGVVTGIYDGETEIVAQCGSVSAKCSVTVSSKVDLGLSVQWASCNLGAVCPWEYGDYYAWGEIDSKDQYSWSNYKWCNGSVTALTKYCIDSKYGDNGFTDNKTILSPDDDVAAVNFGEKWRIPTSAEWQELMDNCTMSWTTLNGVFGQRVTSKIQGYTSRWIFLPAAGESDATTLYRAGSTGSYWSSSLFSQNTSQAYSVFLQWNGVRSAGFSKYKGFSIRPVYGNPIHVTGVAISEHIVKIKPGKSVQLTASVSPESAFEKGVIWSSSNESVAIVTSNGQVTGVNEGETEITATSIDGGFTDKCIVTVERVPVTGVTLNKSNLNLFVGLTFQLTATFIPSDATNKDVEWSSSDESVAIVSSQGLVTGINCGTAKITVITVDGEFTASCQVTVGNKVTSLSLTGNSLFVTPGHSYSLNVSVTPEDAMCNLVWSCSNYNAVSVYGSDKNVRVSPNYSYTGYTTVYVTDQLTGVSTSIKVYSFIENFTWNESSSDTYSGYPLITIPVGGTYQLKYNSSAGSNILNLFGDQSTFVFYGPDYVVSSPTSISISPEGLVTGIAEGITGIKPTGYVSSSGNRRVYIRVADTLNEREYNDSMEYANEVPYGFPMVFNLYGTSDVDWFKLLNNTNYGYSSVTISVEYSEAGALIGDEARLCKYILYDSSMQMWGSGTFSFSNTSAVASMTRTVPAGPLYLKIYFDTSYYPGLLPLGNMTLKMVAD